MELAGGLKALRASALVSTRRPRSGAECSARGSAADRACLARPPRGLVSSWRMDGRLWPNSLRKRLSSTRKPRSRTTGNGRRSSSTGRHGAPPRWERRARRARSMSPRWEPGRRRGRVDHSSPRSSRSCAPRGDGSSATRFARSPNRTPAPFWARDRPKRSRRVLGRRARRCSSSTRSSRHRKRATSRTSRTSPFAIARPSSSTSFSATREPDGRRFRSRLPSSSTSARGSAVSGSTWTSRPAARRGRADRERPPRSSSRASSTPASTR